MTKPTQLTIEHLAAYLPYGVKLSVVFFSDTRTITPLVTHNPYSDMRLGVSINDCQHYDSKLVLRPLPQLTVPITHNGETFIPMEKLGYFKWDSFWSFVEDNGPNLDVDSLSHSIVVKLHSWHFDTFALIEAGLAVAMNPDGTIAK